jgi:RNA polymerase sigma-70 factor (ECF subfamily)
MSEEVFGELYNTVFPILFLIAWRITGQEEEAEDVIVDAFAKIPERNMDFPSLDDAKYWLIRVVKNAALNAAKRKSRERRAYQKAFRNAAISRSSVYEDSAAPLIREETRQEMAAALESLPDSLKGPLILKEYGELNYKEIGRVLGISESNVKVRIFRAREKLAALTARFFPADAANTQTEKIEQR